MNLSFVAALLAGAFASAVGARWWRQRRPADAAWTAGLAIFAIAAGAQAVGEAWELSPAAFRVFYLFGGLLGVAYLGLGTVHLLAPPRSARLATVALIGLTLLSALAVALVPVDGGKLGTAGGALGDAIESPWSVPVRALAVLLNVAGTVALVGGSAWSAWRLRNDRSVLDRLVCNVLLTAGALVVAGGLTAARLQPDAAGGLDRLGAYETGGITLMVAGFLSLGRVGVRSRAILVREANEAASHFFPIALVLALVLVVLQVGRTSSASTAFRQLEEALSIGAVYALIAVGYTMVYGIIELINFAHGDVFTLSAFYAILFQRLFGWVGFDLARLATSGPPGFFAALVLLLVTSMVAAGLTGVLIERVAYRRLRDAPRLAPLITAIGVSFLLEGVMFADFGSSNYATNKSDWVTGTAFTVGGVDVAWKSVFVVAAALAMMVGLQLFVSRARLGKAMRATAQDRDAALLSGININRTIAATFFIGSALAAAGAVIYSIKERVVVWNLGFQFGIIAFTAAVLGGIGNIVGAGLGGFLIGIISIFGGQLIGQEWSASIVFAMLIVVLTFRPTGLLGLRGHDRA